MTVNGDHELWAKDRRSLEKVGEAFSNICPMIIQPASAKANYHRALITESFANQLRSYDVPFFDLFKQPEAAFVELPSALATRYREASTTIG